MRMVDLIEKKKTKGIHTQEEIHWMINGFIHDSIPDYQMSAWMMAVCFNGLNKEELYYLTKEMMESGEIIDLSAIEGIKVDKHSTGGVGDKTSLVLGPMVASCGGKVAKMSGRGLGHTGGTLDKLESIEGFKIDLSKEIFINQVNEIGLAIIGQSDQLVLADKKMYALRDVSATIDSIPLIASSIMSKKLASGADVILLDVKYGDGAFMKTKEEAKTLAYTMMDIGKSFHKDVRVALSSMEQPLGNAIGNSLEVIEAIETLKGHGPKDLFELCLLSGSHLLVQANLYENLDQARQALIENIYNGKALEKFREMVIYQGGNKAVIDDFSLFKQASYQTDIYLNPGYLKTIKTRQLGVFVMKLGGGRVLKSDTIDPSVGIYLYKKVGDSILDEPICKVYSNHPLDETMIHELKECFILCDKEVKPLEVIEEVLK